MIDQLCTGFRLACLLVAFCGPMLGSPSIGAAQTPSRPAPLPNTERSHRLLPADAASLSRLRQRAEVLRALGMAPSAARQPKQRSLNETTSTDIELSPELLNLLQQLSPQSLPGQTDLTDELKHLAETLNQQPATEPGNGQQSQAERLRELLSNSGLSPSDLEAIQRSVQGNSVLPDDRSGSQARSAGGRQRSASGSTTESDSTGRSDNQSKPLPSPARNPSGQFSGIGRQLPDVTSTETRPGSAGSRDDYKERQRKLRQAFGLDPQPADDTQRQASTKGSLSSRLNQQPLSEPRPSGSSSRRGEPGTGQPDNSDRRQPDRLSTPAATSTPDRANQNSPRSPALRSAGPPPALQPPGLPQAPRSAPNRSRNASEAPATPTPSGTESATSPQTTDANQSARRKKLNEIANSDQPVWQKLQQIARVARQEATERVRRRGDSHSNSEESSKASSGFTEKLATVVQDAAVATLETMHEFTHEPNSPQRRNRGPQGNRNKPESEVQAWASSVNDWIAQLPDSNGSESNAVTPATAPAPDSTGSGASYPLWLLIILVAGSLWWFQRRRAEAISADPERTQRPSIRPDASERERLIHSFHELLRQSNCGSEEWWNHSRAVEQYASKRPRLTSDIQSLAAIYEQARYAPDSEPSPEQLAAARSALKQCGQR
ncbi:MAG: hypothetical protein ACYTGL_26965 [Planctomycetota bacterium]|jgi:hypothetical protein